ncbi:hypothetical protein TSOC_013274, partial [Tetrabaena socialis]
PQGAEACVQHDWQQGVQDAAEGLSASVVFRSLHGLTPPDTHSSATVGIFLGLPGADARPCPVSISLVCQLRNKSDSCVAGPHAVNTDALTRAASDKSSFKRPPYAPFPRMLALLASPGVQAGGSRTTAPGGRSAPGRQQGMGRQQPTSSIATGHHAWPFDA